MSRTPRRGRVRSIVRRVALALLCGVLVTFVSTWALACTVRYRQGLAAANRYASAVNGARADAEDGTQTPARLLFAERTARADRTLVFSFVEGSPGVRMRESVGWPVPVLGHDVVFDSKGDVDHVEWGVNVRRVRKPLAGLLWSLSLDNRVGALPLRPLWPGFAVNGVVWGAFAGLVRWLRTRTPRALRRRRGQCERCGYDLRGLPAATTPCPECGHTARIPLPSETFER
jgi:hypothetical protein